MKLQNHILANKLPVITADTGSFPTCTVLLLVGAGSSYETPENNGVAHFFEHMVFKGTQKYPSAAEISTLLDELGTEHNAFTTKDHTGYWIKGHVEHVSSMIGVISQMVRYPSLKEDELEKEKGAIIEEMNMYEDTPMWKVGEVAEESMFDGQTLAYPILGTRKTVAKMSVEKLRAYLRAYYHPGNCVLVVAGGIGALQEPILEQVRTCFGDWENKEKEDIVTVKSSAATTALQVIEKDTQQLHIALMHPAFGVSDERRYAANILANILGGGMSSRLFLELREKRGLGYYVSSNASSYHDIGTFSAHIGVGSPERAYEAISLIRDEYEKIVREGVLKSELHKALSMLKGRIAMSLESSDNVAEMLGRRKLFLDRCEDPQKVLEQYEKVSLDQIHKVAHHIFDQKYEHLAIIGSGIDRKLL